MASFFRQSPHHTQVEGCGFSLSCGGEPVAFCDSFDDGVAAFPAAQEGEDLAGF